MEIEEEIYNKYRDTPFKIETKNNHFPFDKNKDSKHMNGYQKLLNYIRKTLKKDEPQTISDTITMSASNDKSKLIIKDNFILTVNRSKDKTKDNTMMDSLNNDDQNTLRQKPQQEMLMDNDNNNKRDNVKKINDILSNEIEYEDNNISSLNDNKNNLQNINPNIKDKVLYTNNVFGKNNINLNDNENENIDIKNNINDSNMNQNNNDDIKNINEKNTKENFILTVLNNKNDIKKNNDIQKKIDNNENKELPQVNIINNNDDFNNNYDNNNLETIEEKLKANPELNEGEDNNNYNTNTNTNNFIINEENNNQNNNIQEIYNDNNEINTKNIIKNSDEDNEIHKDIWKQKFNFILRIDPDAKGKKKLNPKEISKLKNDLIPQGEINQELIQPMNPNNEGGFTETHDIYENTEEKIKNPDKQQCFYIKAEPIESNNLINEQEEEGNLGTSSEIIDLTDQNSEYTLQTGTNFDYLIKKKKKFSPYIIGLLVGSAGLMFLFYKCKKLREILGNTFKALPSFFGGIFKDLGIDIKDFLEKYNDSYRLLGLFIMVIFLWFIFRILFIYVRKSIKKKNNI